MRVLHLDTHPGWRGGQVQLLHLVRGLGGGVVCRSQHLLDRLRDEGLEGVRWPRIGLAALVARVRPDLIAAHTSHAHGAARWLRSPLVVHRRVDFVPSCWSKRKYGHPRGFVAVSEAVRSVLMNVGVPPARISVVHDGVDPPPLAPRITIVSGRSVALAVGALVPHKDHATLVSALRHLPREVHVAIAGSGPLASALLAQAQDLGVAHRLHLLGHRGDVPALLRSCDVFVHPSCEEGLGQVLIEAMHAGAPIVATRAGGIPEVVGPCARLVPVRRPTELAEAILAAVRRPRDPSAQRRRAEVFSVARMVRQTADAYGRFMQR